MKEAFLLFVFTVFCFSIRAQEGGPVSTLSRLTDGDSLKVQYHSQGCFHDRQMVLVFIKNTGTLSASLFEGSVAGKPVSTAVMDQRKIDMYGRFESELRSVRDAGCTTVDTYTITAGAQVYTKTDGTCRWNGFSSLKKEIFGTSKKGQ